MDNKVSQEILEHRVRWSGLPHMYELDDLIAFCRKKKHIYIYGCSDRQEMLAKYLEMSEIEIEGYVVSFSPSDMANLKYRQYPIISREELLKKRNTGVILGLSDKYYGTIIPFFRREGFDSYFILTEYTKDAIAQKVSSHNAKELQVAVNLVNHCNLDCEFCDHFSPIAEEWFLDVDDFERDISRLSELCNGEIGLLKLLGGEPLLHKELLTFMRIAREKFPNSCIQVFSNGLLLRKWSEDRSAEMNIWDTVKNYEIQMNITRYPIQMDEKAMISYAKKYGIEVTFTPPVSKKSSLLWICSDFAHKDEEVKNMIRFPIDRNGGAGKWEFAGCHLFNACVILRKGKMYTCPRRAYIDILEHHFGIKFATDSCEGIDIYTANNFKEISEFLSRRILFCDYCALKDQSVHYWRRSEKKIEEWMK